MTGIEPFGLVVLVIGLVGTAAVLSNRLSERLRVPAPAFFLVFAAVASDLFPNQARLSGSTVQRVVTIALVFILFDAEAAFLFPWIQSLRAAGAPALWGMIVFLAVLFLGWVYAWRKGDLNWSR